MKHLGDYDTSAVVYGKFTTYDPATGQPATLGTGGSLSVYKNADAGESVAGVTLVVDFDAKTGLHHFTVDTSADGTFYAAGGAFDIVLASGSVGGISVAGSAVASFSLRKDSALKPTTGGRTLDVSATGEAGLDWANIGSPTTAVNLSATNIDVDQVVASVSGAVGTVNALAANAITSSALATSAVDEIVDGVWDELLTGATHNIATSAGRRLRQLADIVIDDGTAQGPGTGSNQIQLAATASAFDGAYDPAVVAIISGTGAGQCRLILQYAGATRTATVDRDWKVNPDATSFYQITTNPGREHVNEGLAQGGAASTITLNALASSGNETYTGQLVFLRSGTGAGQAALIVSYDGATKVATVDSPWHIIPDATTGYAMLPTGPVLLGSVVHTGATVPTVTTVTGLTASDVGAIKAKTDSLAFTVAGQVDANVQYVNDTQVTGNGAPGTEWGPV